MKALFIPYNQAFGEEIVEILEKHGQRGFTRWSDIGGRGSDDGEPHYGSHAWPTLNMAILTVIPDDLLEPILEDLRAKDAESTKLGLRVFVWNIEQMC